MVTMHYLTVECVEPIEVVPNEFLSICIIPESEVNDNGNLEYHLNHENRELLVRYAQLLGFQDADEFVHTEELDDNECLTEEDIINICQNN